jgi:uncharacterized protein (DUF2147 family)
MRWLNLLCLYSITFAMPSLAATNGILGLWVTEKDKGRVLIEPCGNAICGRVVDGNQLRTNPDQRDVHNSDPQKRDRRVKDLMILEGYNGGPEEWRGGSVYDPQTGDESHRSTLTLVSPDTLEIEGCRFLFCRSEIWTRVQ